MSIGSNGNEEVDYITSSRAAQLSGYSQDYVGQLCRGSAIECKRISGEWQVSLITLLAYKQRFSPVATMQDTTGIDTSTQSLTTKDIRGHQDTVLAGDKVYLSSGDAAKRTGYSQDYVGQLARSGAVPAKKIGRKWFIEQQALEDHKKHNDSLLAGVQAEAALAPSLHSLSSTKTRTIPIVTYQHDDGSLVPSTIEDVVAPEKVPQPEVVTMPTLARDSLRKDFRTTRYGFKNKDTSSRETLLIDKKEPLQRENVQTSSISRVVMFVLVLTSVILLVASFFIPWTLQRHMVFIADMAGITLTKDMIESTGLGKNILQLFESNMLYKKQ